MLNSTDKKIVYLDKDTLRYMFLTFTGEKVYPVMKKLFAALKEGFENDLLATPLGLEYIQPYIENNKIRPEFRNMMGEIGQVQFHQRFTIKTLQLIRIISHFFEKPSDKPMWRDAFTSDPDEKYRLGFNRYNSIIAQHAIQAISREKQHSQVFDFIESFRSGVSGENLATRHFRSVWEQFPDLIRPALPAIGAPETHMNNFLMHEEIRDIPEFHIISSILYPMFEAYGIEQVEHGLRDEELIAAEAVAAYLPYCHYYVTKVDIAEVLNMSGVPETYEVRVYDHNESSLYRLIQDIKDDSSADAAKRELMSRRSAFRKDGTRR